MAASFRGCMAACGGASSGPDVPAAKLFQRDGKGDGNFYGYLPLQTTVRRRRQPSERCEGNRALRRNYRGCGWREQVRGISEGGASLLRRGRRRRIAIRRREISVAPESLSVSARRNRAWPFEFPA